MNLALSVVQCRPGEPGEFISSSPRAHLGGPNHGVYKPFYKHSAHAYNYKFSPVGRHMKPFHVF